MNGKQAWEVLYEGEMQNHSNPCMQCLSILEEIFGFGIFMVTPGLSANQFSVFYRIECGVDVGNARKIVRAFFNSCKKYRGGNGGAR